MLPCFLLINGYATTSLAETTHAADPALAKFTMIRPRGKLQQNHAALANHPQLPGLLNPRRHRPFTLRPGPLPRPRRRLPHRLPSIHNISAHHQQPPTTSHGENPHRQVRMRPTIPQRHPHLGAERQRLVPAPAQKPREQRQRKPLQSGIQIRVRPHPDLLVMRVPRPPIHRPLARPLRHALEARRLHHARVRRREVHPPPGLGGALAEERRQPVQRRGGGQGAVVAAVGEGEVLHLEVAAGLEVREGFGEEVGVRGDGAREDAAEDEVEGLGPGPVLFEVVELEGEVWGDPWGGVLVSMVRGGRGEVP